PFLSLRSCPVRNALARQPDLLGPSKFLRNPCKHHQYSMAFGHCLSARIVRSSRKRTGLAGRGPDAFCVVGAGWSLRHVLDPHRRSFMVEAPGPQVAERPRRSDPWRCLAVSFHRLLRLQAILTQWRNRCSFDWDSRRPGFPFFTLGTAYVYPALFRPRVLSVHRPGCCDAHWPDSLRLCLGPRSFRTQAIPSLRRNRLDVRALPGVWHFARQTRAVAVDAVAGHPQSLLVFSYVSFSCLSDLDGHPRRKKACTLRSTTSSPLPSHWDL